MGFEVLDLGFNRYFFKIVTRHMSHVTHHQSHNTRHTSQICLGVVGLCLLSWGVGFGSLGSTLYLNVSNYYCLCGSGHEVWGLGYTQCIYECI